MSRADWELETYGYSVEESDVHSGDQAIRFKSGETLHMRNDANVFLNGRYTAWFKGTPSTQFMFYFRSQRPALDTYYDWQIYPTSQALRRKVSGSSTWLVPNAAHTLGHKDGNWHKLGVRWWTGPTFVTIQLLKWDGAEYSVHKEYNDPLGSAILIPGHCEFRCASPSTGQLMDDITIEELEVEGP